MDFSLHLRKLYLFPVPVFIEPLIEIHFSIAGSFVLLGFEPVEESRTFLDGRVIVESDDDAGTGNQVHLDQVFIAGPVGTAMGCELLFRTEKEEHEQAEDETAEAVWGNCRKELRHVTLIPEIPGHESPWRVDMGAADDEGRAEKSRVIRDQGGELFRRHPQAANSRDQGGEEESESIHRTHPGTGPG